MAPFSKKLIASPVGNNLENREDDVRRVKGIFSNLGYYKRPVENGIIDQETDTAIHTFQKDNNLKIDGYMNPGGETEGALVDIILNKANNRKNNDKPAPDSKENEHKNKCSNEKQRYALAVKNVDQKRNEIQAIRASIISMLGEIDSLENIKKSEKESALSSRITGGLAGAAVLGLIGGIAGGPGGAAAGIGRGLASGGAVAHGAEEIADAISGTKPADFDSTIENLQKSIEEAEKHLEENLVPALDEAIDIMVDAQNDLKRCMEG